MPRPQRACIWTRASSTVHIRIRLNAVVRHGSLASHFIPARLPASAGGTPGIPRSTFEVRRVIETTICASLSSAPARLTRSPSTSPSRPSRSASLMRTTRLSRSSSRRARWAGSGRRSEHLTHACSWMQGAENARPQMRMDTLRFSKCAKNASHSSSVGVRYSALGRVARRRAMKARCASIASCG